MKKNMLVRIAVGLGLAALFIGLWLAIGFMGKNEGLLGELVQIIALSLVNVLCVYEMKKVLAAKGLKTTSVPYAAAVVLPILISLRGLWYAALYALTIITVPLGLLMSDKKRSYEDLFAELAIYAYPLLPLIFLYMVCAGKTVYLTQFGMLFTFACPLFGDTFAYFTGVAFGKRKLCEHISPKKTVAGAIGGLVGSALAGLCCYLLRPMIAHVFSVEMPNIINGMWEYVLFGAILGFAGQTGDLFASCIKRWAGVKDFGSIFPGHGGMLDRIDSVLFCAPFVALWLL